MPPCRRGNEAYRGCACHGAYADDGSWKLATLSPSDAAFYARLRWELWRGPLGIRRGDQLEPTPADEQVMILRLPGTPADLDTASLLTADWRDGELW